MSAFNVLTHAKCWFSHDVAHFCNAYDTCTVLTAFISVCHSAHFSGSVVDFTCFANLSYNSFTLSPASIAYKQTNDIQLTVTS